ncbi:MAG: hypothetical protein QM656_11420 [Paracoccaceae bacterium]
MLSLTDGFSIDGVDFFRDDERKELFYYLPNRVQLLRNADGSPQFQFVLYQAGLPIEGKQQGGGFLLFTVELVAPADIIGPRAMTTAQGILRGEAGVGVVNVPTPQIRPVNFIGGAARLLISSGGGMLLRMVDLGKPALFGNNTVSVMADMPFEGAQVFADVLRQGGAIASVEYNLQFEVRLPAVTIDAHIEASRVREVTSTFTEQEVESGDVWGSETTKIRRRTGYAEFLEEHNVVQLDIKPGSSEVELDDEMISDLRDFALSSMDKFINDEWVGATGVLTPEDLRSEWLTSIEENLHKDFHMTMTQSDVIVRPYNPSAIVDPTFISADVKDYLIVVDTLAHPFFKRLEVDVSTSFDFDKYADYVHSIVVDIRYDSPDDSGRRIEKAESFIFSKGDAGRKKFVTAKGTGNEYEVTAEVHYKNGPVLKQRLLNTKSVNPAQVINVANPGEIDVTFAVPAAGFGGDLLSVDVELTYEDRRNGVDPFSESRSLTRDEPAIEIVRPVWSPQMNPFRYRTTHVFQTQSVSSPWIEMPSATRHIRVPTPFEDQLMLDVIPSVDWTEMQAILVVLTYDDPPNDIRTQKTLMFLPEDAGKARSFTAPLKDPANRKVRVAETHVMRNGAARNLAPRTVDADGTAILVGNAPGGLYRITLSADDVALGTDVRRIMVDMAYQDAAHGLRDTHRAFLRAPGETSVWSIALADPAVLDYTWRAEYTLADTSRVLGPEMHGTLSAPDDWLFIDPPPN